MVAVGRAAITVLCLVSAGASFGQNWGLVTGRVQEAGTSLPVLGASIIVDGTNYGTASGADGTWILNLPVGHFLLRITAIGYTTVRDSVIARRGSPFTLDVTLAPATVTLEEVEVTADAVFGAGVRRMRPEQMRNIPTPLKGFQALHSLPGVAASNELSNQYSVRGGGFNENLIFLNGFEIHMPFRPRQGEQEGLGLLNPDLARQVTLYTGGFPARYGGKLSSTLDIEYGAKQQTTAAIYASLLDAGASASGTHGEFQWVAGIRRAQARRFFATQELEGQYRPDYVDAQLQVTLPIAARHDLELVGIWADHEFNLDPRGRRTYFGIVSAAGGFSDFKYVWTRFDDSSRQMDGYRTSFLGARIQSRLLRNVQAEHDVAYFGTVEHERFLLAGQTLIYDVVTRPDSPTGLQQRGSVQQSDRADNRVGADTWTTQGRYSIALSRHAFESGWSLRRVQFDDNIDEHVEILRHIPDEEPERTIVDEFLDQATMSAWQYGLYAEDAMALTSGLLLTAGLRADHYTFNKEWTFSPRLSLRYEASDRLVLTGAGGIYYQSPTYRELRGSPVPGTPLATHLNRNLQSQQSMQLVAGAELFVPRRRILLHTEAYFKRLRNLISYSLDNVRVDYSGVNDARGHTYGLDIQARGEFVPGMESWVNYGFLVSREKFLPEFADARRTGSIARPTDQRHTVALVVQDYVPTDSTWKLHLRGLFGSGLPYTSPVPDKRVGQIVTQVPGNRHGSRFPAYRRVDVGVTKYLTMFDRSTRPVRLELTAELLNAFDMVNTVAYSWVPDGRGIWQRIPTRLTPRTFNLRLRATL